MVNFNSTINEKQANNNNNKTNCMRELTVISVRTFLVVGDREANFNNGLCSYMEFIGLYINCIYTAKRSIGLASGKTSSRGSNKVTKDPISCHLLPLSLAILFHSWVPQGGSWEFLSMLPGW